MGQIYNLYFELANFFKDIFNLFSKVLKIKEKKQQLTAHKQKPKSLAKANAICAFAYLQTVITYLHPSSSSLSFSIRFRDRLDVNREIIAAQMISMPRTR
jgi:hypothetical protein